MGAAPQQCLHGPCISPCCHVQFVGAGVLSCMPFLHMPLCTGAIFVPCHTSPCSYIGCPPSMCLHLLAHHAPVCPNLGVCTLLYYITSNVFFCLLLYLIKKKKKKYLDLLSVKIRQLLRKFLEIQSSRYLPFWAAWLVCEKRSTVMDKGTKREIWNQEKKLSGCYAVLWLDIINISHHMR